MRLFISIFFRSNSFTRCLPLQQGHNRDAAPSRQASVCAIARRSVVDEQETERRSREKRVSLTVCPVLCGWCRAAHSTAPASPWQWKPARWVRKKRAAITLEANSRQDSSKAVADVRKEPQPWTCPARTDKEKNGTASRRDRNRDR